MTTDRLWGIVIALFAFAATCMVFSLLAQVAGLMDVPFSVGAVIVIAVPSIGVGAGLLLLGRGWTRP